MEFKFKRKYTDFFIFALLLHISVLVFWLFFPYTLLGSPKDKVFFTLLALLNVELILLICLGLFKQKYIVLYNKLIIKRMLAKNITITYGTILNIKENPNDSIIFGFGSRPSFSITYIDEKRKKRKVLVRCDNAKLLLQIIKNEMKIANK